MVQIIVSIPAEGKDVEEWGMLDLQGDLETRHPVPLSGKFIGDLHFTQKDVPVLIIGHHILYGKVVNMEKPFAVLVKNQGKQGDNSVMDDSNHNKKETSYTVTAIIKKKLLFKSRPKPIIANVPKKI
ncbi:chromosome transmission fidelity protein 8 homolog isoform X1 [Mytilus trossulus]|uniref:chromosome transmission fidelity protein 8 homolog isoform X1 n=2 Tax=Mytilus trossulus TaxID=6551 RepID=UPI0030041312